MTRRARHLTRLGSTIGLAVPIGYTNAMGQFRFRQLFDAESSTYTYLVWDDASREAALIDPVAHLVLRDMKLVGDLGLSLRYVLETHVHADHVSGAGELRRLTSAKTVYGAKGPTCADLHLENGAEVRLGECVVKVLATPGHTDDSVSYFVPGMVFTGDALLIRGCGRTDFQNGDAGELYDSIATQFFTLPDDTTVFPGHDYNGQTASTIGEEKRLSPRLAGKTRDEFIAIMGGLNLPPPKKLAEAVPANLACGRVPN